jgi:hypothetical protein
MFGKLSSWSRYPTASRRMATRPGKKQRRRTVRLALERREVAGVLPLYSPLACPGYNGAIEAAIGWVKKRSSLLPPFCSPVRYAYRNN